MDSLNGGSNSGSGSSNRTVCFCHAVTEREIVEAIQKGAQSLHGIQLETLASTGCGGCEYEVREILDRELTAASGKTKE